MTQVKDKTDQQLSRELAELMGYTVYHYDKDVLGRCYFELTDPEGYSEIVFGGERNTELEAWADVPNYCTDPAASLEVQAKAIEVDSVGYVRNLELAKWKKIMAPLVRKEVSVLLTASPRERAEAAYLTLKGQ